MFHNKLAQQIRVKGHDAATLNMLLGFYGEGQEYTQFKSFNVDKYDCICFDEVLINPPNILKKIDEFMQKHPEKKYFATGDVGQLQPINWNPNNIVDKREYLRSCINKLFPNIFVLKINKRLKTDKQRNQLEQLQKDVFDPNKDIMTTLKTFGFKIINKMSDVKTQHNICYFNFRTNEVNKHVHTKLIKSKPKERIIINKVEYWQGLELICKEHFKEKGKKLYVNYSYNLTAINQKDFTVKDIVEGTTLTLPINKITKHFSLPMRILVIAFKASQSTIL